MKNITLKDPTGQDQTFECADVIQGVALDPRLPADFECTAHQQRTSRDLAWWRVPFLQSYRSREVEFLKKFPEGVCYHVRCLDGGAWDRSTWLGAMPNVNEAAGFAARLADSLKGHAPPNANKQICPFKHYDQDKEFLEKVEPLLMQVKKICEEMDIPLLAAFATKHDTPPGASRCSHQYRVYAGGQSHQGQKVYPSKMGEALDILASGKQGMAMPASVIEIVIGGKPAAKAG